MFRNFYQYKLSPGHANLLKYHTCPAHKPLQTTFVYPDACMLQFCYLIIGQDICQGSIAAFLNFVWLIRWIHMV